MDGGMTKIAVVQGASSADIQQLFRAFTGEWRESVRIAGIVEDAGGDGPCNGGRLLGLADGARYSIFHDVMSDGCNVSPDRALSAGQAIAQHIAAGCDLVIISKFGRLEAEQKGGLLPAFIAAAEANVPILTSVSPKFEPVWAAFTENAHVTLPPDREAIEQWWLAQRTGGEPTLLQARTGADFA